VEAVAIFLHYVEFTISVLVNMVPATLHDFRFLQSQTYEGGEILYAREF